MQTRGVPRLRRATSFRASGSAFGPEQRRRPLRDRQQVLLRVELEMVEEAEPLAQRRREEPRPRRRADHRERLQRHVDRPGERAAVHRDVDPELLHRRVNELLDHGPQAVDLVDEEHVALLQVRQDAHQVGRPREGRAAGGLDARAHLGRHHVGHRGLAQAGRPVKEDVLERFAAALGGRRWR